MNPVITPTSCNLDNGKIKVTAVSPVSPPYRYIWKDNTGTTIRDHNSNSISDSIYNVAAGNYTLDVFDNFGGTISCQSTTFNYSIGVSPLPSLNITSTNLTCYDVNDGTASVSITGGQTPFSYQWSAGSSSTTNTIFGLTPGIYSLTVTRCIWMQCQWECYYN